MALGSYPLLKLAEARERVFAARKLLADGIDPMAERKAEKETAQVKAEADDSKAQNTFRSVAPAMAWLVVERGGCRHCRVHPQALGSGCIPLPSVACRWTT